MTCCFLECSLIFPTHEDLEKDYLAEEPLLDYENDVDYRKLKCTLSIARFLSSLRRLRRWFYNVLTSKGCRKCWCRTIIIILILLLGTFILLFVVFPLLFKNSAGLQRSLIFNPVNNPHSTYENLDFYCSERPKQKNHYFVINNLHIGYWNVSKNDTWGYNRRYYNREYYDKLPTPINMKPTIIFFHMENGDRQSFSGAYCNLAAFFNIIAFDYRSYGDSSKLDLIENGLVDDSVHLYKWIKNQTQSDIYVWGDTLGAAIATHTISRLRSENIVPTGLILENPFTTLSEKVTTWYYPLGKIFSWTPWYDAFVTQPLTENDLSFKTSEYIMNVDCPILIWKYYRSAASDLTEKIALIAAERDSSSHGSVTLKSVWWTSSGGNPSLSDLSDFITECTKFKKDKKSM